MPEHDLSEGEIAVTTHNIIRGVSEIDTGIRDSLKRLERLVREAGENGVGDHIQQIIQLPDQITALHEVFSKYLQRQKEPNESPQRQKKPNEAQTERHNFFTNFSYTGEFLSPKQVDELTLITKDWKIDNKQVHFLRAFAQLWQTHPMLFWHGPPDSNATRRCIEDLEHIRRTDSSKRKVLLVLLSEDVSLEQERVCTCPDRTHSQRDKDLKSQRAPHHKVAVEKLCQNLYPGISGQQKRAKKARISLDSLCGWRWSLLKNVALVLSLLNANIKRYELRSWKILEIHAINAYVQTLPQVGILDDLERAWESIVTFYRGSYQQRVQASDCLLVPINAQELQPTGTQPSNQWPIPTGISKILEIPLIDNPGDRKRRRYRQRTSRKRQCLDIEPHSDVGNELVQPTNEQPPLRTPSISQPNTGVFQTATFNTSACENVGNNFYQNGSHTESIVPTLIALHETSPQLWSTPLRDALSNTDDPEFITNTMGFLPDTRAQIPNLSSEQEALTAEDNPEFLTTTLERLHSTPLQLDSIPEGSALIEASRMFFRAEV